eukprot:jgi/Hompol1/1418/HPOL_005590-RA
MSDFKKLVIRQYARDTPKVSEESSYWASLKSPVIIKEFSSVNSVQFSAVAPYDFCISSSTRVQVYSSVLQSVKKTVSRFKDVVHAASIRSDGKLLAGGDASGLVQIFELGSRAILRTLRGHQAAVHVADFCASPLNLLTASDDKTAMVWDIPGEQPAHTFKEHTDYVRTALQSSENQSIFATGSYDHTVKLWDTRTDSSMMTLLHGSPIESILMLPGGNLIASAGGNRVKIWDIMAGGKLIHAFEPHQKTVMALRLDGTGSYLLTGSLDHHVKIISLEDYKIVHSVKYPAPILSLDVSPTNSHLVVGMTSGLLSVRQRAAKTAEVAKRKAFRPRGGTHQYFIRGSNYVPEDADLQIESKRKLRINAFEKLLRSFQVSDALDAVLKSHTAPVVTISMLEELIHRDALRAALAGRDEYTLAPILAFIFQHIGTPKFTGLLTDVCIVILDIYSYVLGQSDVMQDLLRKLKQKVRFEIQVQQQLANIMGLMDTLISVSSTHDKQA